LGAKAALTGSQTFTGTQTIVTGADANQGLIVRGNSGTQSGNLQEWQNSNGAFTARIASDGAFSVGVGQSFFGGSSKRLFVLPANATTVPATVRGAVSQTANLTEWQNSAGSVLSRVNASGNFLMPSLVVSYDAQITAGGAAVKPLVVKGAASQTANLQEWQNSAGTPIAFVANNGIGYFNALVTGAGLGAFAEQNGGANIRMTRSGAAISAPSNQVRLMVLAGTTGSRLVAVGPSGTVYTILDNIV
jgi:hypothetical protein